MTRDESAAEAELRKLQDELATCPDELLPHLFARATALADRAGWEAATDPARAALYTAFDTGLRIGEIPLPVSAPDDLRLLLSAFCTRWVVQADLESLKAALDQYTQPVRGARQVRSALRAEVAETESTLQTLTGFLAALDALVPAPGTGPGGERSPTGGTQRTITTGGGS
jgi:hypothetical protein